MGNILLLGIMLMGVAVDSEEAPVATYRNPVIDLIGPADPMVLLYEGRYYLYPTLDAHGFNVFVSDDLVRWDLKGKCYTDPRGGMWAPDVFHDQKGDGRIYLYYTADTPDGGGFPEKEIGVAVADDPLGPFEDKGVLVDGSIDAHVFQDDDGSLYFYYVEVRGGFKIKGQPMKDLLTLSGEPRVLITPTDPWEQAWGQVTEGPWMLKHNDTYYLMYSGSGADGPEYAIGYATSQSPLGPFVKHPDNPIARKGGGIYGPGHHCVVTGPDGGLWMVYHQQQTDKKGWDRFLAIDPLWFDENGVIHTKITRGTDEAAPKRKAP